MRSNDGGRQRELVHNPWGDCSNVPRERLLLMDCAKHGIVTAVKMYEPGTGRFVKCAICKLEELEAGASRSCHVIRALTAQLQSPPPPPPADT